MKLFDLLKDSDIKYPYQFRKIDIKGISYNSQKTKKGFLFAAIKGFSTNGHKYIISAIKNKASLIAIENISYLKKYNIQYNDSHIDFNNKRIPYVVYKNNRILLSQASANFYNHPSKKMKLIGITGTNGKTTTSYLIEHILSTNGYKVGVIGTINYRIGKKIIPALTTTPESLELHSLLNDMLKQKVDYVIMEVSSHSLALNRVDHCHYDHVVFTNLTEDHFDFHKNFSNYFKAKQKLFDLLLKSEKKVRSGFINNDDKYGIKLLNKYKNVKKVTLFSYGIENKSDFKANNITMNLNKIGFDFNFKKKTYNMVSKLIGRFNVYNILSAIGIGILEKIPIDKIVKSISQVKIIPGRLEIVESDNLYVGIDYAHTEDALLNVLKTVHELKPDNIITVFGCGGDRDKTKRPLMGEVAGKYSDYVIITSDNPRTEDPVTIIDEIEPGVKKKRLFNIPKF